MIPLRLSLRNFLCYRDNVPPLDFAPIHQVGVACLAGDNGHGKSALLDAITWALWGRARARSDDDLIHMGQEEMAVELEFLAGDAHYRVIRKHRRGTPRRSGQTSLELQLRNPTGFVPLTGDSLRQTQRRIIDILRMDYDTFVNSAFLLQGKADKFTTSPPSERKEVLGRILGLDAFDRLAERARELARERRHQRDDLEAAIRHLDQQLAYQPQYQAQLREAERELAALVEQMQEQEETLAALRSAKGILDLQRQRRQDVRREEAEARQQIGRLDEGIAQHRRHIAQHREVLDQAEEVRQGYQRLLAARDQERALGNLARQLQALEGERVRLERRLEEERQRLLREEEQTRWELNRLEPAVTALPQWQKEYQQVREGLARLQDDEERASRLRQQAQEAQLKIEALAVASQSLRAEMVELQRKAAELAAAGARCPLCGQPLDAAEKGQVQQHYQQEQQIREKQIIGNEQQAQALAAQRALLGRQADQLAAQVAARRQELSRRGAELERDLAAAHAAQEQIPALRQALLAVQARLAAQDYAPKERERLAEVDASIAALGYDPARHATVQQERDALERYDGLHRRLEEAERLLEQEQRALAAAQENRRSWQKRLEDASEEAQRLEAELAGQPDLERRLATAQQRFQAMEQRRGELGQVVGALRQKLEDCALLEGQRREKERAYRQAEQEREVYEELAVAFGRSGAQALLIDAYLPEIENEANRLLSRMTDGRMTVTMSTQRITQRGTTTETLEIRIADQLGTRSYELFSGGEAFRIDFALRVALAKFLAHRAGAPLPTLIIDEGFGTQDSAGREGLVAAINAVQPDFRCILVITHIDELREAFPIRIEVTKGVAGSTFYLVGAGSDQ